MTLRQPYPLPSYTWALTTSARAGSGQTEEAKRIAGIYHARYIPREDYSLRELRKIHELDYLVTLDRNGHVYAEEPYVSWHPSMAVKRLKRLEEGGADTFLTAVSLEKGDHYLDCTLGLGADAIVASWAAGETGVALGLEASPMIAMIASWGLKNEAYTYHSGRRPVGPAASRIQVLEDEALHFLQTQADGSWDVVYFDPMFQSANPRSSAINSIRPLACYAPFGAEALEESLRVCAKRVVLKERWFSPLFADLGATKTVKTRNSPVAFGVWEKGKDEHNA